MPKSFTQDFRKENPGLHLLYVKTAVKHLHLIGQMMRQASDCSNMNMLGVYDALLKEREILVTTNAAYADADEILKSIFPTDA